MVAWVTLLAAAEDPAGATEPATQAPVVSPEERAAPAPEAVAAPPAPTSLSAAPVKFYVIPVRNEISEPTLFMIRRGVKEAESVGAQFVVLDMDTPGGSLGVTLEIIEILQEKFRGRSVTFVNREAISAGAIIASATDQIHFSPRGIIGAAAPVNSDGKDIDETMKQKILSYMRARVESATEGHKYRAEVLFAMMDANYELKIDDVVIKPKGELLSLTAQKAMLTYGDPPSPLLGSGIAEDLPALYDTLAGGSPYEVTEFKETWSLGLAHWLTRISPVLMALGGLLLFIEFKTPGFGVFGISGILLLLVVFFGHNIAGLSGHEPMLFFLLGAALVFIELLFFPGLVFFALTGILLMFGSLLWGMADVWPNEPISISGDLLTRPLINMGVAAVIAGVLVVALARFIPQGWFFQRLAISHPVAGSAQVAGASPTAGVEVDELVGRTGVAVTGLFPSGQVEVGGRRYEARAAFGVIEHGATVVVMARSDFGVIVEARHS